MINVELQNSSSLKLIFLFVFMIFSISTISTVILNLFTSETFAKEGFHGNTISETFIIAVLITPIIETLLFQTLIIEIFYKKIKNFYLCILSATLFALSHSYNLSYVIFALLIGILLAYLYILGIEKKTEQNKV